MAVIKGHCEPKWYKKWPWGSLVSPLLLPTVMPKVLTFLLTFLLTLLVPGCGLFGTGSSGAPAVRTGPSDFPSVEPMPDGMSVVVMPFDRGYGHNVFVALAADEDRALFSPPVTLPGYHWRWEGQTPTRVEYARLTDTTWTELARAQIGTLSQQELPAGVSLLRYRVDLRNSQVTSAWPAAVGGFDSKAGSMMLTTVLNVLPSQLNRPLRVYLRDQGLSLKLSGNFRSCGEGCAEFSNFVEALDTPLSVALNGTSLRIVGAPDDFPFLLSANLSPMDQPFQTEMVENVRLRVKNAWEFLNRVWGEVPARHSYTFHLIQSPGCSYQGLEHHGASLLSVGSSCPTSVQTENLLSLATHEMIHVWNAKHIYSAETAHYDLSSFSSDRLKQLYMYEGFTEGFARIVLAQFASDMLPLKTRIERWNETIANVNRKMTGRGLNIENLSVEDPFGGYQLGAFMALRAATLARKIHGPEVGKAKFWEFLKALADGQSAGQQGLMRFDLKNPMWVHLIFSGRKAEPFAQSAQGYRQADVLLAFKNALGEAAAVILEENFYVPSGGVFASNEAFNSALKDMAETSGLGVGKGPRGTIEFSPPDATLGSDAAWPF